VKQAFYGCLVLQVGAAGMEEEEEEEEDFPNSPYIFIL
jgi:hypothetical protein